MNREEALELIKQMVQQPNLIKHMLATEAVMKALANYFNEDESSWGLAGLLHDVDYAETYENPEIHALRSAEILREKGVSDDIIKAILAHNDKAPKDTLMAKALYAVDPLTGFLVACALMTPEKKMAAVDVDFAMRRFKEKAFAKGANREQISYCREFGLSLEEFLEIGIKAMQSIADDLGL